MKSLPLLAVTLYSLLCTSVASEAIEELVPVPRHEWDHTLQKRQAVPAAEAPANVMLQDHEQLLWTTPPNSTRNVTVSMIAWTGQNELIIDMAKFAWHLKAANCTVPNLSFQFYHKKAFELAINKWEWVNFNDMRSFVIIPDHLKCGKEWSIEPLVVSNARYDREKFIVHLDAKRKTWKQVMNRYAIDFGEVKRDDNRKRWLDFDLSKAFSIPLETRFPTKIIEKKWPNADFAVNCVDCGTSGALVFAGHIEGDPFGGVDTLTISVTPENIQANLGLEITFGGRQNFRGQDFARQDFELLEIPLPSSWSIPRILHFGPQAKVIAGYELEEISGRATVSTGVTGTIPSDSLAKVEIFGNRALDIHGWVPTFSTQPLTIEAEVTASGSLYAGIAVGIALEILEDTSINLDLNLKFPEFHITASGGYNSAGFCPNNPSPWGVSLDVSLGAELELIAWNEVDGKRNNIFDVDLYENDNIYDFPSLCFSLDGESDGTCAPSPDVEIEEEMYVDQRKMAKRSGYIDAGSFVGGSSGLATKTKRQEEEDAEMGVLGGGQARTYHMTCDTDKKWAIKTLEYPLPSELRAVAARPSGVPALWPLLSCGAVRGDDCQPDKWAVKELIKVDNDDDADDDDDDLDGDGKIRDFEARLHAKIWNTEHVYEANWIRDYFDYLYDNHFKDVEKDARCEHIAKNVARIGEPANSGKFSLSNAMLNNIGNDDTYLKTMVLLTGKENRLKYLMFDGKPAFEIDAKYRDKKYKANPGACALGRIINVCNYMKHPITQSYMTEQLKILNKVMDDMNAARAANDGGPASYKDAHKAWFEAKYQAGITKGITKINEYAELTVQIPDFNTVNPPLNITIANDLTTPEGVAKFCVNNLAYPDDSAEN